MKDFWVRRAKKDDLESICKLLEDANLPLDGVTESLDNFILAEGNGIHIVGAAGLEVYGRVALLRSVVVASGWKGFGVGRALTGEILSKARARGIESVYLLTTTAEQFFPSFGFVKVDRAEVPEELEQSPELRGACPASATVPPAAARTTLPVGTAMSTPGWTSPFAVSPTCPRVRNPVSSSGQYCGTMAPDE